MDASSVSGPVCLFICSPIVQLQLDGVGGADIGMQRPCIHRLPCRKHLAKMDIKWLSLYKLLTFLDSCPRSSLECKGEKVPPQAIYVRANSDVNQLGFGGLSLMQDWARKCMPYARFASLDRRFVKWMAIRLDCYEYQQHFGSRSSVYMLMFCVSPDAHFNRLGLHPPVPKCMYGLSQLLVAYTCDITYCLWQLKQAMSANGKTDRLETPPQKFVSAQFFLKVLVDNGGHIGEVRVSLHHPKVFLCRIPWTKCTCKWRVGCL